MAKTYSVPLNVLCSVCTDGRDILSMIVKRRLKRTVMFHCEMVIIDFSLTVKAATLIFISGRSLAISSDKQGKSGSIHNLVKKNKLFGPSKRACIS